MAKPVYRVKLGDSGYYAARNPWTQSSKKEADVMSMKEARALRDRMVKYYPEAIIEPAGRR